DEVRLGMTWADVLGENISRLQLAQLISNSATVLLTASPNYLYQLQASSNVSGPWSIISNWTAGSSLMGSFVDTNAANPERFYRAVNGSIAIGLPSSDLVLADFEQTTYGSWATTGSAFG